MPAPARFLAARSLPLAGGLAALTVLLDQASKLALVDRLRETGAVVVTPFFNLALTWNRGVSFGILNDGVVNAWVFFAFAVLFAVILAVWMVRTSSMPLRYGLALMIGGALGNAIDRLRWGAVADFLDVHALGWHFWTFNLADAAITGGAILLVADSLFRRPS
jgi:signal peptidase II